MTRFVDGPEGVQRSDARTFLGFAKGKRTNAERKYFFTKESRRRLSGHRGSIIGQRWHGQENHMLYLLVKAVVSGILIAAVSVIARRNPGFGALVASLPLVSVLGMIW